MASSSRDSTGARATHTTITQTPRLPSTSSYITDPHSHSPSQPPSPRQTQHRRASTGPTSSHERQQPHLHPGTSTAGPSSQHIGISDRRRGATPRHLSTPIPSSNDLHLSGLGLGSLGNDTAAGGGRKVLRDDALSSPRRISTSRAIPSTQHPRPSPSASLLLPSAPTNEAYYSQPPSASTPRFRQSMPLNMPQTSALGGLGFGQAGYGSTSMSSSVGAHQHRRNLSVHSTQHVPVALPASPGGSVFRRIRKTASAVGLSVGRPGNYDGDDEADEDESGSEGGGVLEDEDEARRSNGTRVWYSSYVTIDWIHDAIKESSRVRRLRANAKRSHRGAIRNSWDRFQGWLVVTIIGVLSAIIAFMVIRTEMAAFDLKEGYCSTSWGAPKRFCCSDQSRLLGLRLFAEVPPPVKECADWIEWGEWWGEEEDGLFQGLDFGSAEFGMYGLIALGLAGVASLMTVYLTSSEHHITSKDSTLMSLAPTPAAMSPITKSAPHSETEPLISQIRSRGESSTRDAPPRKVMYYAAGSGIPEIKTILSGFVIHGYLGGWTLLTKSVGLALSVGSGLSLGKEGPLVHIACCVGNIVSRLFTKFELNEAKRREVLSAACAAGVSVAFGAPIGGVLFSLEETSTYFPPKVMWRSFWCAAVAAISLKALNPFGNGSIVLWAVTYTRPYHNWEFLIFGLLGIFGGVYGAVFSRLNYRWAKHVRQGTWVGRHPIVEVLLVTGLTTLVSFMNPYCRMGGTEFVATLFAECKHNAASRLCVDNSDEIASAIIVVATALIIKGCLTVITFGIKLPAGIFIPSLVVGACFGRIVGMILELVQHSHPDWSILSFCGEQNCVVPGLYAMVGASATLAGVTRTTVSLVVIMVELTGSLNYVVPIMLAVLLAKTVADGLEKKGIYDLVIELNQLPYLDGKHEYLWGSRVVEEIVETAIPVLRADSPCTVRFLTGRLLELVRHGQGDVGFPVVVRDQGGGLERSVERGRERGKDREKGCLRVVGFLGMNELEHALDMLSDEPDALLNLMPPDESRLRTSIHSIFSFADSLSPSLTNGNGGALGLGNSGTLGRLHHSRHNPYDLSRYIDRAPITVQLHSPLELVQQMFVKLGARQLLVVDGRGGYRGLVTKKGWLRFLEELEGEEG